MGCGSRVWDVLDHRSSVRKDDPLSSLNVCQWYYSSMSLWKFVWPTPAQPTYYFLKIWNNRENHQNLIVFVWINLCHLMQLNLWVCLFFITGPLTHSVGARLVAVAGVCRRMSSSVTLHGGPAGAQARLWRHAASSLITAPRLDDGLVVLRPVRATPCSLCTATVLSESAPNLACGILIPYRWSSAGGGASERRSSSRPRAVLAASQRRSLLRWEIRN